MTNKEKTIRLLMLSIKHHITEAQYDMSKFLRGDITSDNVIKFKNARLDDIENLMNEVLEDNNEKN